MLCQGPFSWFSWWCGRSPASAEASLSAKSRDCRHRAGLVDPPATRAGQRQLAVDLGG